MLTDDELPRPRPEAPLETLSSDDLRARIEQLRAEIARCEALLAARAAHRAAIEGLFRSPGGG